MKKRRKGIKLYYEFDIDLEIKSARCLSKTNSELLKYLNYGDFFTLIKEASVTNELRNEYLTETLKDNFSGVVIDCVDDQPFDLSNTATLFNYENMVLEGGDIIASALGINDKRICLVKNFRTAEFFKRGFENYKLMKVGVKYPIKSQVEKYATANKLLRLSPQTCRAVYRASVFREAQTTRIITVWGNAVSLPAILEAPIGLPVKDLLEQCGAFGVIERVVRGGVLTGKLIGADTVISPFDTSVTALTEKSHRSTKDCINCGRCTEVCPKGLAPYYILRRGNIFGVNKNYLESFKFCDRCSCCAYVCPSKQPLSALIDAYVSFD